MSQNITPLSASEPRNLVADGYAEFRDNMVKGSAPIQMIKKGLGEALWREKKKLAMACLKETQPALKGLLTSDAWLGLGLGVK
jgi:hypothetical protein